MYRKLDIGDSETGDSKRMKVDESTALVVTKKQETALTMVHTRKSSLPNAEMTLSGHEGAVYGISFDDSGRYLSSCSFDKQIFLWDIQDECKNYNVLSGHKSAVLEVKWRTETSIISCSADKTVAAWDANKGTRTRKLTDHTGIVNSCAVSKNAPNLFVTASDDCTAILWDIRSKQAISSFYHDYPVCSAALSDDGLFVFTGGVDNIVRRFDARAGETDQADLILEGHTDTITGLAISPDGQYVLSNAMDSTLRCWDIRPFVAGSDADPRLRCRAVIPGVHHGAEKLLLRCSWSPDQEKISCGSADRNVHVWETHNFSELYYYPGHKASVNEVIFHPKETVLVSASSDKQIMLGEFN